MFKLSCPSFVNLSKSVYQSSRKMQLLPWLLLLRLPKRTLVHSLNNALVFSVSILPVSMSLSTNNSRGRLSKLLPLLVPQSVSKSSALMPLQLFPPCSIFKTSSSTLKTLSALTFSQHGREFAFLWARNSLHTLIVLFPLYLQWPLLTLR